MGAGGRPGAGLDHDQATSRDHVRQSPGVEPHQRVEAHQVLQQVPFTNDRPDPAASLLFDGLVVGLVERPGELPCGPGPGAGLVRLHPGEQLRRELVRVVVDVVREVGEQVEWNLGFGARFRALQADHDLLGVTSRVAEQALVDVADLLHVQLTEGDLPVLAPDLGVLHRPEHVEHGAVVDQDPQPTGVLVDRGEPRETRRVEQRAAVGRHPQVLERRSLMERAAGGEQPVPGVERGRECLVALHTDRVTTTFVEVVQHPGDGVPVPVQRRGRQQLVRLGEQQEHDPHHRRHGRVVDLVRVVR